MDITQIFRNGVDFRGIVSDCDLHDVCSCGHDADDEIIAWTSIGIGVRSASQTRFCTGCRGRECGLESGTVVGCFCSMIITGIQMSLLASQYGPGYLSSDEAQFTIADVFFLLSLMFSPEGPLVLNENYLLTASGMRYGGEFLESVQ